ncbi:hypothetical protein KVT40_005030 [Elsinoe batatas]|uniref:Uncharacterized protein n=1 Tax=Elsinoe batatas TaxID=2601811 RepID=A0A8K0L1U0_9PEZI|nr:hypothetical protein KVT40_005030 [Elsinoe batatas]
MERWDCVETHNTTTNTQLPSNITTTILTTTTILSLLPLALALPTPQDAPATAPQTFAGIAIRSASPIQYATVNAISLALYLQRPTTTYCPSIPGLTCPSNPSTLFVGPSEYGTLSLKTTVPGGQQVYIAADGRAKFTQAHSANTGVGSTVTGFSVKDGGLQWQGNDFVACPASEAEGGGYAVFAAAVNGTGSSGEGCLGFKFRVEKPGTAEGAWQYA